MGGWDEEWGWREAAKGGPPASALRAVPTAVLPWVGPRVRRPDTLAGTPWVQTEFSSGPNLPKNLAQMVKDPPAMQETQVQSLGREDSPGGGHGNPLQYSCLQNPQGRRSLAGSSPWGCKESDMTEGLSTFG